MIGILGAGSVGLGLAARLAHAGQEVVCGVRRPEAAEAVSAGVRVREASSGECFTAPVPAVVGCAALVARLGDGPLLLCVRGPDTPHALASLETSGARPPLVCLQNGMGHEERAALRFPMVIGGVFRQTCTRTADAAVTVLGSGRIVLGLHPHGEDERVGELAARLAQAGFDVGVSTRIGEDKWLKLCSNLCSAPNALVRRSDHRTAEFVETKARLLEEARAVLGAAGIVAASCDGRDRSLDAEIAWQREALARGESARDLPVYNQVWTSLRRFRDSEGPLEAEGYHERILALAARHGLDAPVNRRVLEVLRRADRERLGPESVAARELLPD